MKANSSRIAVILDRSGSMDSVKDATIDGFNEFVKGQKETPGECSLKLVQFDQEYEEVFDKPLAEVPALTAETYRPRGNTALLDAMGRTIVSLGDALAKTPEADRPSKVIVMILTDGLENASRLYSQQKIAEMVTHQKERYHWDFVFLGSNQDAVLTASRYGIKRDSALTYQPTKAGMRRAMATATRSLSARRSGRSGAFSDRDRQ